MLFLCKVVKFGFWWFFVSWYLFLKVIVKFIKNLKIVIGVYYFILICIMLDNKVILSVLNFYRGREVLFCYCSLLRCSFYIWGFDCWIVWGRGICLGRLVCLVDCLCCYSCKIGCIGWGVIFVWLGSWDRRILLCLEN